VEGVGHGKGMRWKARKGAPLEERGPQLINLHWLQVFHKGGAQIPLGA
jgi:hypothetical protein